MRQSFPLLVACACTALAGVAVLGVPPTDPPRAAESPAKESVAGTDRYGDALPDGAVARLGTVRFRHDDGFIRPLVYTPDGKTLVSGGSEGTVRLWEVKSGRETLRIHGYIGDESSAGVAVAPDGKTAASPGSDHLLHLWDMTTGKDIRLLHPPPDAVPKSAAFSPDGKTVVAAIFDDSPCVWETATGKLVWQAPKQKDVRIDAACFSPDGKYVAAGSGGEPSCGKRPRANFCATLEGPWILPEPSLFLPTALGWR
jgi:WD40 repeat protein